MSKLLNTGEDGGKIRKIALDAIRKWRASGILNDPDTIPKINIAMLYESSASAMLNEVMLDKVNFHTKRYEEEMDSRHYEGAQVHLHFLIEAIQKDIYKNHC
jgi:hypothetical protein